jgi:hypothetical protein
VTTWMGHRQVAPQVVRQVATTATSLKPFPGYKGCPSCSMSLRGVQGFSVRSYHDLTCVFILFLVASAEFVHDSQVLCADGLSPRTTL